MNVYIVEDCENSPGKILAVFADRENAEIFAEWYAISTPSDAQVLVRTLWYGQPPRCGVNL
jgi:hypothetical protein